jgi:hypothetical protein
MTPKTRPGRRSAPDRLRLRVALKNSQPRVWRLVEVDSDVTLATFADALLRVMGWDGSHLSAFFEGARPAWNTRMWSDHSFEWTQLEETDDSNDVALSDLFRAPRDKLGWIYDLGDGWTHQITCEAILPSEANAPVIQVIRGRGRCPFEDCGGVWGWANLLEAIKDPDHPDHADMREWTDNQEIDPESYTAEDIAQTNAVLATF